VLLIAAEGDLTVPPKVSAEAAARIPGCELVRLPGYGHLVHEEVPDGLASVIEPWLAKL
jgi:magnesium chelatase accessory protein